ncbi:MAG: sugar-binding protein [Gemmatimonadota bacterium]
MNALLIGLLASATTLSVGVVRGPNPDSLETAISAVRVSTPIEIDGRIDEPGWENAARIGSFWEIMPQEGVPAVRPTEVRIAYDETHLYVAFTAHDDPDVVRATEGRRDQVFEDDLVMVSIDPRGTSEWAYGFGANPHGIQVDMRDSGMNQDPKLDLIYESAGRITQEGFTVEMAIPFSSVGGAPSDEAWRLNFMRVHPRGTRHVSSWMPVTRANPCVLCQHGRISGFGEVESATSWSVMPTVTGSQTSERTGTTTDLNHGRVSPEVSVTAGVRASNAWRLDATYNPDFSHVESDAAQIDVNSTLALSFPEKRPFFQQGSELYETPMDVIYTRSLNDPDGALKARGSIGSWDVGYMGAHDETSPLFVPLNERTLVARAGGSTSHLLRTRRSLGGGSFTGAVVTDRSYENGARNTVFGIDGIQRLGETYTLAYQVLGSRASEAEEGAFDSSDERFSFRDRAHTARHDGEEFAGYGVHLALSRRARNSTLRASYEVATPTLRAANGFLRKNDYHDLEVSGGLSFQPEHGIIDDISPRLEVGGEWTFDGRMQKTYVEPMYQMMMTGQTAIVLGHYHANESFAGQRFDGLDKTTFMIRSQPTQAFGVLGQVKYGDEIARMLASPEVGRELTVLTRLMLRPSAKLSIEPQHVFSRLTRRGTRDKVFSGWISRIQASYQLNREISVRLTGQYNSFRGLIEIDPLVTYQISPYTMFYVGATHDIDDIHGASKPWALSERQIFMKFQYRFGN